MSSSELSESWELLERREAGFDLHRQKERNIMKMTKHVGAKIAGRTVLIGSPFTGLESAESDAEGKVDDEVEGIADEKSSVRMSGY